MTKTESIIRFGTDGWQARFDGGFTDENIARLAEAIALAWEDEAQGATVYVGFDTRYRAHEHAILVAQILAASGLQVILSDAVCPTPAVAWNCAQDPNAIGAVIITASKRSCEYGGILIRSADGSECSREFIDKVENLVSANPTAERAAFYERDLVSPYLSNLIAHTDVEVIKAAKLKLVVDPMYGSAKGYLAQVLTQLGCEVHEIHAENSSDFGNIHPEPMDPWADKCEQAVRSYGACMGLLLDGDGDRSGIVDENGTMLTPQEHVALVLQQLVEGRGEQGRVVTTLSSSALISRQATQLGLTTSAVPVGFSRLYREMIQGDVILAAEEYAGIGFPPHLLERDGLLACLLMVELVARVQKPLSQIVSEITSKLGKLRYARRDIRLDPASIQALRIVLPGVNPSSIIGREPTDVSHADGLRLDFADGSWMLIRPSRTDPVVRIYAEAASEQERDAMLDEASNIIKAGF